MADILDLVREAEKEVVVKLRPGYEVRLKEPDFAALAECTDSLRKVFDYLQGRGDHNPIVTLEYAARCVKACAVVDEEPGPDGKPKQPELTFEQWCKVISATGGTKAKPSRKGGAAEPRSKLVAEAIRLTRKAVGGDAQDAALNQAEEAAVESVPLG